MRHYETMFILKPTLVEEEIKAKIEFYKEVITKHSGVIETSLDMGMRNLAYEIKKHKRGYYYVIYFKAEPSMILELERLYRINEDVLRFIVIKYDSKKEVEAWHSLVDRANKKPSHTKEKHEKSEPTHSHNEEKVESTEAHSE
ncbi:30S ribosomal protein S6 [Helicobacter cetorum]|uniref:Small ribosomal subunit protein bS6 n=1 Tax=Helicobacter cetorum (strain ATCC BAA-540 / CCUG 52418 / MIT 99-5656) TaxID=1163745 RepID=I0EQ81_HELCM|nr:30S ribosomal protein S6 [Helicobacter cetorum]AFI05100.1 30S ribosomal protein S6 [Helicobacter cetorum MIT 99-5656]